MTSINCCADALTKILQLIEHTSRSNASLARIRAVTERAFLLKREMTTASVRKRAEKVVHTVSALSIWSTFYILNVALFCIFPL